jgi:protoporphyrin/coproporphyrin ferrochelatase
MIGILLTNLGTPDAPTPAAVRRYLAEFLGDPRVVEIPRAVWLPILYAAILPFRPKRTAHAYTSVWTPQGSPLLVESLRQSEALQAALDAQMPGRCRVRLGMTYGQPSIAHAWAQLQQHRVTRLIVVPLYPQYSSTTTAAVFDAVARVMRRERVMPEVRLLRDYHNQPNYIAALAASVRRFWAQQGRGDRLLMSFHGLPKRNVERGDPYQEQCLKTAQMLADALELNERDWYVSFQSRFGKAEWLQPYTDQTLIQWARAGGGRIDVLCPGFAVDCLETLEEIAEQNRELYLAEGGKDYRYIPALNADVEHITFLRDYVVGAVKDWL